MSIFGKLLSGASMAAGGGPMGMLVGAGLGAGMGMLQGQQQRAMDRNYNNAQAEMTRVSNWTGKPGEIKEVTNPMNTMLAGAGTGAALGQKFGGGAGDVEVPGASGGSSEMLGADNTGGGFGRFAGMAAGKQGPSGAAALGADNTGGQFGRFAGMAKPMATGAATSSTMNMNQKPQSMFEMLPARGGSFRMINT